MGAGAAALVLVATLSGRIAVVAGFGAPQWIAGAYLGVAGGALAFILWVMALVGEPMTLNLIAGLVAVFAGIWIATTEGAKA